MGDPENSFIIVTDSEMPPGIDMKVEMPNVIHISDRVSPTEKSILLTRFFLNMTYRIGKASGAITGTLTEKDLDGMTVGIWQWLTMSGLSPICFPFDGAAWIDKKRQEIQALQS